MTEQQGMALLTLLEELIPVGIGLYKQLQATIVDHGTKPFEDLLTEADNNFSHVLKNVEAEKAALAAASVPDATGISTDPVASTVGSGPSTVTPVPPPSTPIGSQGSPGSGTAVPPKTA